ncbi:TPA: hypothetical protein ACU9KK_002451 [Legionella anisa]|uniref:hypothetical protein n=1 Tax=Legionella anisa TaxID=28082 RepID=UPI000FDC9D0C|nr:hypothetical protein [Legionella anisa]MCW8424092.1 hypothetical protein [Legionella anisa]MCW8447615.1 hypothetical protein [Legionella anisa]UAK80873.1 hypothetical protein K8O89_07585 [Legionella anisa]
MPRLWKDHVCYVLDVKAQQELDKFVRQMNKLTPAKTFGEDESVIRNTSSYSLKNYHNRQGKNISFLLSP